LAGAAREAHRWILRSYLGYPSFCHSVARPASRDGDLPQSTAEERLGRSPRRRNPSTRRSRPPLLYRDRIRLPHQLPAGERHNASLPRPAVEKARPEPAARRVILPAPARAPPTCRSTAARVRSKVVVLRQRAASAPVVPGLSPGARPGCLRAVRRVFQARSGTLDLVYARRGGIFLYEYAGHFPWSTTGERMALSPISFRSRRSGSA